ncbi:DUF2939 domain-containing protein [Cupriavidus agavae]|uniref:DUF2939 family protein n=1 Tax=Cupriavidus agavae TaxID=1001822 RepID=A0A4Q7S7U4_9BURK|nr:DUF2939 domain-containing protein [Cupriavidus agavae]RZT42494.1 DUF2939 family protein [Cupriavidus agavae]
MNRKILIGVIAIVAVVVVTSYASPYWTIYQMRGAIEKHDAETFSKYVDYAALRENLKAQLAPGSKDAPKDHTLAGLGQMIGGAVADKVVDVMVTPEGVMALMSGEKPGPQIARRKSQTAPAAAPDAAAKQEAARDAVKYSVSYRGWSLVQASAMRDNGQPIIVDLRRHGLWSWKVAGARIPGLSSH